MKYLSEKKSDARLANEMLLTEAKLSDYSEEAIPERDPAYVLPDGTDYEGQTVEAASAESRRDLARRLQQLGMSPARAAVLANL